jgi:hypothetical protein
VEHDASRGAADNAERMHAALQRVRTGGVTVAARDDPEARFRRGDSIGFVGDELVAWGEPQETLAVVLGALVSDGVELLTCIEGENAPLQADDVRGLAPDGIELDYSRGGQPSWWWLLAAE